MLLNLKFNSNCYPYLSRRSCVYAKNGMIATSQPLAAQSGLEILQKGGNAIDAAIATAAVLTVVEPTANGIGGDAFALVWYKNKLHGLNASGPTPKKMSIDKLVGHEKMPKHGALPITVPGAVSSWVALNEKFGRLSLIETLKPAIKLAEEGFPVSPVVAKAWQDSYKYFKNKLNGECFKFLFETFFQGDKSPKAGEIWSSKDHAKTLKIISEDKGKSFYQGDLAEKIVSFIQQAGGFMKVSDLAEFKPEWVNPININYRGFDVWEIPPNGHGIVALMALNILKGFDDFHERDTLATYHRQIEAIKLSYADAFKYLAEPSFMKLSVQDLLSDSYADERRKLIGKIAQLPESGQPNKGGTVYLCTADNEGNMVSFIQSNYMGFGSGLVVPGTGIALHNRGNNFTLKKDHPNQIAGAKRPYHTIIPGFLTKNNQAVGPFGVMGGFMQPQGHVQMIMNTIDFGLNPQASLDAPRWEWIKDNQVAIEHKTSEHLFKSLAEIGHEVNWSGNQLDFGRGQIIWRDNNNVFCGGTESRTDGAIASF